jgi:hypothetical protein
VPVGNPIPAADAAHDAFSMASMNIGGEYFGVGIVKSTASTLLNSTSCPNGTQENSAIC